MNSDKYNVPKTQANLRLKTIYNDPNFKRDAITFRDELIQLLITKGLLGTPEHFTHCSRDVILRTLGNKVTARYDDFLQQYGISDDEYWAFLGLSAAPVFDLPIAIDFTLGDTVKLKVYPWARRKDLIAAWPTIKSLLSNREGFKPQYKGPADPQLLYAVMKARDKKIKFGDIAEMLNKNALEGYKCSIDDDRVWTQWILLDHYNRYKHIVNT